MDWLGEGIDFGFWSYEDFGCMMVIIVDIEFYIVEDDSLVFVWICLCFVEVGLEGDWYC